MHVELWGSGRGPNRNYDLKVVISLGTTTPIPQGEVWRIDERCRQCRLGAWRDCG